MYVKTYLHTRLKIGYAYQMSARSVTTTVKTPVEAERSVVVVSSSDISQTETLEALKTEFGLNRPQARQLRRFLE